MGATCIGGGVCTAVWCGGDDGLQTAGELALILGNYTEVCDHTLMIKLMFDSKMVQ